MLLLQVHELFSNSCIVENPLTKDYLKRSILEINLRTELMAKGIPDTKQFDNKSYRFSAYRSMFFWLDKKKGSKKPRKALPACLVTYIRSLYPDDVYTGFQPSSPVIRGKKRRNFSSR